LARLVIELGTEVYGCVEMMSGAVWVRERLHAAGWRIDIADARKVKAVAPLACKTDRVDARVLAELARRELVPDVWVPSLDERALRELLRRRTHLVRLRTSAINRTFGLLTQWGLRTGITALRKPGASTGSPSRTSPRRGVSRSGAARGDRRPRPPARPDSARTAPQRPRRTPRRAADD